MPKTQPQQPNRIIRKTTITEEFATPYDVEEDDLDGLDADAENDDVEGCEPDEGDRKAEKVKKAK